jgi:hypothetical protein
MSPEGCVDVELCEGRVSPERHIRAFGLVAYVSSKVDNVSAEVTALETTTTSTLSTESD